MHPLLLACLTAVALAGCGADDGTEVAATPTPTAFADVRITYDQDGTGGRPPLEADVRCEAPGESPACRALSELGPDDFAPPPDNVACTQIFGGEQTASVTGVLRGERINARFSRTNGCEIARWEQVKALFGTLR